MTQELVTVQVVSNESLSQSATQSYVLVINAVRVIERIEKGYFKVLTKFNNRMRILTDDKFSIRDRHVSNGKVYRGRYFVEKYYDPEDDSMKQKVIGTHIPEDYIPDTNLPPCPKNPLEGFDGTYLGENIVMTHEMYDRFKSHFVSLMVVNVAWSDS